MILKMKKYTFLVYHKQYTNFLEKIREIGLLHVIERDPKV
jgi:V/A-type H+-transporting ATPase subunit I